MRSRASYKAHPIHPALIPFPFAFLTGAFVADLVGRLADDPDLSATGGRLLVAGIVAALVAAVPGFIDYFATVPPRSSAKRRATRHMLANLAAVALFAVAWLLRDGVTAPPGPGTLVLEGVATALLMAGGWMGGTLVNRNLISVDHRHANAGKWRERRVSAAPGTPTVVARSGELETNQMLLLHVGERRLVLARTENGWAAFDDHCTHRGGSLADGTLACGTVQCLWHGSQFDVRTGQVRAGPAERPIGTYRVEERDGEVRLTL